jgi:hypothetical protein
MDSEIIKVHKAKIAAQQIIVNNIKAEMDSIHTNCETSTKISLAKEEEWRQVQHVLTMLKIELGNLITANKGY